MLCWSCYEFCFKIKLACNVKGVFSVNSKTVWEVQFKNRRTYREITPFFLWDIKEKLTKNTAARRSSRDFSPSTHTYTLSGLGKNNKTRSTRRPDPRPAVSPPRGTRRRRLVGRPAHNWRCRGEEQRERDGVEEKERLRPDPRSLIDPHRHDWGEWDCGGPPKSSGTDKKLKS